MTATTEHAFLSQKARLAKSNRTNIVQTIQHLTGR